MINNAEFFGGIEPCDLDCNCASSGTASGWAYNFDAGGSGDEDGNSMDTPDYYPF